MICTLCGADTHSQTCEQCGGSASLAFLVKQRPDLAVGLREVVAMCAAGRPIQAIKQLRELTGLGLKEAKDIIDGTRLVTLPIAPPPLPTLSEDEVVGLVRAGRKIEAIKRVREETGCGLKEAKDQVEEMERRALTSKSQQNAHKTAHKTGQQTTQKTTQVQADPPTDRVTTAPRRPGLSESRRVGCVWLFVVALVLTCIGVARADGKTHTCRSRSFESRSTACTHASQSAPCNDQRCRCPVISSATTVRRASSNTWSAPSAKHSAPPRPRVSATASVPRMA